MYKISVIMAIYNVEEFLEDSIKSVLNQTMKQEDIELLLMDDCSTDKSGEIAKKYAEHYENIRYYCLPQNSGMAGRPRNIGIQMAQGKYVMFLDPDDLFVENACEMMYECIEKQKVKFITANLKDIDIYGNDLNHIHIDPQKHNDQFITIEDCKQALSVMRHACTVKIVEKEFLIENEITFLEGVPAEDAYFTSKMFLTAKKAYFRNEAILCYRRRTTGNLSETNKLDGRFFKRMLKANVEIYKLFQEFNSHTYYQYYYVDTMIYLFRKLVVSKELTLEAKVEILEEMSELIGYWQKARLPLKANSDVYGLLILFKEKDKKILKNELKHLEEKMQADTIDTIRENERNLMYEVEQSII